jgi:ribose 5-phosphate isomerase A
MPLPVEIAGFGWKQTAARLRQLGVSPALRYSLAGAQRPFATDNGGLVLDCETGPISDPGSLAGAIKGVTGVVEHGLFLGVARSALQVDPAGEVLRRVVSDD